MQSFQNATTSPWIPLLEGDDSGAALRSLAEVAEVLQKPDRHSQIDGEFQGQPFSLGSGAAGIAVFLAYLEKTGFSPGSRQCAFEQMNRAIQDVANHPTGPSLYSGFTGVGWAAEHITKLLAEPDADLNSDLDNALEKYLAISPWKDDYDLISGLAGVGVYCLERAGSPGANHALELIVDRLYEMAERSEEAVTWFTPPSLLIRMQSDRYPKGFYNLGVAHGVPGVIALLGRIYSSGIARDKTGWLLERAIAWLLKQSLPASGHSSFADVVLPEGPSPVDCRLGWCYGDAGIAAALLLAARYAGNQTWERQALAIAQRAARRDPATSGVTDACVCHGSAGLAHIFNRIYQASYDELYADTARYWLERTLTFRNPGKGAAGYLVWGMGEKETIELQPKLGLIQGIAGIGLVLLAAVSDVEPFWDRIFQMDVPPRPKLHHD